MPTYTTKFKNGDKVYKIKRQGEGEITRYPCKTCNETGKINGKKCPKCRGFNHIYLYEKYFYAVDPNPIIIDNVIIENGKIRNEVFIPDRVIICNSCGDKIGPGYSVYYDNELFFSVEEAQEECERLVKEHEQLKS